jgi:Ca-activated chloride channel family protein
MNCATALILLLDVSGSINAEQWDAQRAGHAAALRAPAVVRTAEADGLAIAAVQFGDRAYPMQGWTVLRSAADVHALAARIDASPRLSSGMEFTATGTAVLHALTLLEAAPCGDQAIIDVVSDGRPTAGVPVTQARDAAEAAGVKINALIVGGDEGDVEAARAHLITPGGFVMQAATWGQFADAIRRKLVQEIGAR